MDFICTSVTSGHCRDLQSCKLFFMVSKPSDVEFSTRIVHRSRPIASLLCLIGFGFLLSPVWTLRGIERVWWVIVYFLVLVVSARGWRGGAFRTNRGIKIRGLLLTRSIPWHRIQGVQI